MEKELLDAFRKLKQRSVDTFPVTVVSVDKGQGTCIGSDGTIEYTDIQLSSIIDGSNKKFLLFPKVGSSVLVSPILEDIHRLYVEVYSEVDSLELVIENVEFKVDAEGFLLKKENETLKKLMADLIAACKNLSFTVTTTGTAVAQTGETTLLLNLTEFEDIEIRFNQFLKDN